MTARNRFLKTLTGTAVGQLFTALLYLLSARNASPTTFGSTAATLSIAITLATVIDFGSNSLMVRQMSEDPGAVTGFAERTMAKIGLTALLSIPILVLVLHIDGPNTAHIALPFVLLTSVAAQTFLTPLTAQMMFGRASIAIIFDKAAALLVGVAALAQGHDGGTALWIGITVGQLFSAVLCVALWPRSVRTAFLASSQLSTFWRQNPWKGSVHFGLGSLTLSASSLDIALIAWLGGANAAGSYAAVNKWVQPMGLLAGSYARSIYPSMARAQNAQQAWTELRFGRALLIPVTLATVLIATFSEPLVRYLIGSQYSDSDTALSWLAIGMLASSVSQPIFQFLQARHKERSATIALISGISFQLALVVALTGKFGATGGAASFAFGQVLLLALLIVFSRSALGSDQE